MDLLRRYWCIRDGDTGVTTVLAVLWQLQCGIIGGMEVVMQH